jgi:hypothetical protein
MGFLRVVVMVNNVFWFNCSYCGCRNRTSIAWYVDKANNVDDLDLGLSVIKRNNINKTFSNKKG